MHISLSFTKKEFDELITLVALGEYIRDGVLDDRGEYGKNTEETLLERLYAIAEEHNIPGIKTETFHGSTYTGPNNERSASEHIWIEDHDDSNFWHELTTRLSHRDFLREMTEEDRKELEKSGWFPEKIQRYFEKYDAEFESYGTERLEINKKASVPSSLLEE